MLSFVVAFTALAATKGRVFINITESVPPGVYWRGDGVFDVGDLVMACPPKNPVSVVALERNYILSGSVCGDYSPLLKFVVARHKDVIDVRERSLRINGSKIAEAILLEADSLGRPLPRPQYPITLAAGQVWLYSSDPQSFDSRYFGPVAKEDILGSAIPVALWPSH